MDKIELPLCGKVVGCAEAFPFKGEGPLVEEVEPEPFGEIRGESFEVEGQLVRHPRVEFFPLPGVLHELVEDRGLDVGEHDPMEKLEEPSFYERGPVYLHTPCLTLVPGDDPCHDHFVGLLPQFGEGGGVRVVVPPLHACRGEDEFD